MPRRPPATARKITVERGSKRYQAMYWVSNGVVTVSTTIAQRTTPTGGLSAEALARQLLRDLVDADAADEERSGP